MSTHLKIAAYEGTAEEFPLFVYSTLLLDLFV